MQSFICGIPNEATAKLHLIVNTVSLCNSWYQKRKPFRVARACRSEEFVIMFSIFNSCGYLRKLIANNYLINNQKLDSLLSLLNSRVTQILYRGVPSAY